MTSAKSDVCEATLNAPNNQAGHVHKKGNPALALPEMDVATPISVARLASSPRTQAYKHLTTRLIFVWSVGLCA